MKCLHREYSYRLWYRDYLKPLDIIEWGTILNERELFRCEYTYLRIHEDSPWRSQVQRLIRSTL
jgi:hypothetical protein